MYRFLIAISVLIAISADVSAQPNQATIKARIIKMEAADDLALARALDGALGNVSSGVTACVNQGGEPSLCQCKSIDAIRRFDAVFVETIAKRPSWDTEDAVLYWEDDGRSINIALSGARRALKGVAGACPRR